MFRVVMKYTKDLMTAADNLTYSMTKFIAITGVGALTVRFIQQAVPDFLGYALGVSVVMAALAGKYFVETKHGDDK